MCSGRRRGIQRISARESTASTPRAMAAALAVDKKFTASLFSQPRY
jgi:hypothetical protein